MKWLMIILVGFLVFVGVEASINHFFQQPYNEGFLVYPVITGIHVISGGMYLLFAPFQFAAGIRTRWIKYHRYAGRALVIIGFISRFYCYCDSLFRLDRKCNKWIFRSVISSGAQ